jgi:hypothetical protein
LGKKKKSNKKKKRHLIEKEKKKSPKPKFSVNIKEYFFKVLIVLNEIKLNYLKLNIKEAKS